MACVEGDAVLGVACGRQTGEITLNYVSPHARLRGVSSALVAALEAAVKDQGHVACVLDSITTALWFYRAHGYAPNGVPGQKCGLTHHPMIKTL